MLLRKKYIALSIGASLFLLSTLPNWSEATQVQAQQQEKSYQYFADIIRKTYESQLYTLPAFEEGHYALRMYRQTSNDKYHAAIWSDLARVASRLNRYAEEVHTPEQIYMNSQSRLADYLDKTDERSKLRYTVTKHNPEYLYLGIGLLGSMARADEYGLKHKQDAKLREIIRRYDFSHYVTNEGMIKAWAAQLANQVYWLKQLGEQDVVQPFIEAFRNTYPDNLDENLTNQQYGNKLYGMTHIIFADSQYYQHAVSETEHQWIFDYFRSNIDTILLKAKEDIIAEVGISFLLAGLNNDPVVEKTRLHIKEAINRDQGMIPSTSGDFDLSHGEHRNVLAIMLLDWQQVNSIPTIEKQPKVFASLPYGLVSK
ncbi:DUF3541 domain-containing protein [Vibrio ziniensis]|uniref:DUF3541 domain-containing protein n=1 Tax=Vibrio ziniensis TaxID=2711221 RepID=A0A6G7CQW2_9VIBR|nr:DUF3541 domain-containing protein [Vibrio ziniensis]QIH44541.1 DUF3541 domain-containing protein [Vibrio ziniensis]